MAQVAVHCTTHTEKQWAVAEGVQASSQTHLEELFLHFGVGAVAGTGRLLFRAKNDLVSSSYANEICLGVRLTMGRACSMQTSFKRYSRI